MPVLSNPRHERFAQEVAKGKSATEAYRLAGYKDHRTNAARLMTYDHIMRRADELKERGAIRAEISIATLTEDLKRIALKAEELKDASGLNVARAATMDIAKLHGKLVERKHHTGAIGTYDLTKVPDDDLDALESILGPLADAGGDQGGEGA